MGIYLDYKKKKHYQYMAVRSFKEQISENLRFGIRRDLEMTSSMKKEEIAYMQDKFSLDTCDFIINFSIWYLQAPYNFPENSLRNVVDLFYNILKGNYEFSSEELTNFVVKNISVFKTNYNIIRSKCAIFNYFNMLDDVFLNCPQFLSQGFPRYKFGAKELYAIIMENKIISLRELSDVCLKLSDEEIDALVKKYPLTNEDFYQMDELFQRVYKKATLKAQYIDRRLAKKMATN